VEGLKQMLKASVGSVQTLADFNWALTNASEKSCCLSQIVRTMEEKENRKSKHTFYTKYLFSKILPFMRKCRKIL